MGATIQEVARGDYALASTGFISPWSIAALAIPTPNEVLLKKFAPLLCGDEVFIIASAITEPHAGESVEDVRLKGTQIRMKPRLGQGTNRDQRAQSTALGFRETKSFSVLCVVEEEEFPGNQGPYLYSFPPPGAASASVPAPSMIVI